MKKTYGMILGALVLVASLWPLAAFAVEVKNWEYKGHGHWTLGGHTTDVIIAQAKVGEYPLYIMYDKTYDGWYMSFLYANDDGFPIMNEDGRRPTFFVRTSPGLGSGRYDTDYEIDRDAVVVKEDGFYQFSMRLDSQDIRALKRDLDMGADYWLDDGTASNLWRTFRFPGSGAEAAIAQIEAEIAKAQPAASAPAPVWQTRQTAKGAPYGLVSDLEGDTAVALSWSSKNTWVLAFSAVPELPDTISSLRLPVRGTDDPMWLSCGPQSDPDRNMRRCYGDGELLEGEIEMLLYDDDVDLIARGDHLQIQTSGPQINAVYSLKGSAAVIAEIKRYNNVTDKPDAPSEDMATHHDKIRGLLDGFRFPDHLCTEPVLPLTLNPSEAELEAIKHNLRMFVECTRTATDKDDDTIAKLVFAVGGTISTSNEVWSVPARCKCRTRIDDYMDVRNLRIDARSSALGAITELMNELFDAIRSKNAGDAKAAVARHNPIVAQIWPDLDAAVKGVSEDVRRIYERHGTSFNPPVFREIRYR